ncbi:DUF992 domain-containing protein [Roseomonas rosulenta]|uniref:DUF992 domain-containing protein n=1 Tax=Roseomonas rosulenta TaxID=2748667 RepID=UPI0018DFF308|nr:DUF992 domain-containing protein [Roseomonas rosulenta]
MTQTPLRFAAYLAGSTLAMASALAQAPATPPPSPSVTQAQQQTGRVGIGALRCDVAAGTAFVFGSTRQVQCVFSPVRGATERYTGEIRRFGVDIGFVGSAVMLWGVLASSGDTRPGALAGTYAGVSAAATAGVGVGANVLVGGSDRGITLQPVSVEGNTGLNIALGVGELVLTAAPN